MKIKCPRCQNKLSITYAKGKSTRHIYYNTITCNKCQLKHNSTFNCYDLKYENFLITWLPFSQKCQISQQQPYSNYFHTNPIEVPYLKFTVSLEQIKTYLLFG